MHPSQEMKHNHLLLTSSQHIFSGDKSVDKDTGDCSFFSGDEAESSTTGKQSILFTGDKSADKVLGLFNLLRRFRAVMMEFS